jgi:DNA processing protein
MSVHAREVLLHLSLIQKIGPATIAALSELCPSFDDWIALYNMSAHDLVQRGIQATQARLIVEGLRDIDLLVIELALIEKHAIRFITILDDEYPELLKHIYAPAAVLYVRGSCEIVSKPSLGIVGSRQADVYGERAINYLVPRLVEHQWVIVSGGALGADTMAHRATVHAQGSTVAILGAGLLNLYPATNKQLFEDIIASGGALVSPFPLRMNAMPGNFPARNRIIAGLSHGIIVIQAAERSGASITAHCALEQGREVFAIPGPFDHPLSIGCHKLIKQGATLVTSVDDILSVFGQQVVQKHVKKVDVINHESIPADNTSVTLEDRILAYCALPSSIDELCIHVSQDTHVLLGILFDLQLAGKVTQNFAGMWQKV